MQKNAITSQSMPTKANESSEEDNELGEETISGENDVEYAEFSLSVRTSPKEQIKSNKNVDSTGAVADSTDAFDDFMVLPITSNLSSKIQTFNSILNPILIANFQLLKCNFMANI